MKLIKRLFIISMAFLIIGSLSGCRGLKVVQQVASVNGQMLTKGEYLYYLENVKSQMLQEAGVKTGSEEANNFWDADIDGEKAADVAKNRALEEHIRVEIANILAKDAKLSVDSSTKANIVSTMTTPASDKKEQIEQLKTSTGLTSDELVEVSLKGALASQYAQYLSVNQPDKIVPSEEEVTKKYMDEYVRVKHVLLMRSKENQTAQGAVVKEEDTATTEDSAQYEAQQKQKAEDVLKKAKGGANFDTLVAEYGEDPGMQSTPNGYTFTKNSGMVAEFEDASFAIAIGQISDLVETTYGWHILKRYPLLTEGDEYTKSIQSVKSAISLDLYNKYLDEFKSGYNIKIEQGVIDKIKIK